MSPSVWQVPKGKFLLKQNEINIWRVNASSVCMPELRNVLSPDELLRAYRYYFQKDRENFIISRGVLRFLVAHYLNKSPEQLVFIVNKYGKPFLKKGDGKLKFNVSHSNGTLLFAFSGNFDVGIDIEYIRTGFACLEIASHFFSGSEVRLLSMLPDEVRNTGFFNCWTRKEAFIKAKGQGLSIPLDSFDVSLIPGETARLVGVRNNPGESNVWKIINLDAGENFCAALAVKGDPKEINYYEWTDEFAAVPYSP